MPLVLCDIPTYRELWDEAALFFPARDAVALADMVNRLIGDPALSSRMGAAARRRAASYNLAAQVDGMMAIYEAVRVRRSVALETH